ncbi:Subunit of heteropentameric Replication factor C (RF-C) [Polyplax serrata]|uniref:Subunit of heteropentameric Replication factor C (RF-C) n=1 Tax=Polyplax serrata TaxID=468196 RepID=A0ABR1BD44_POLSC
MSLWCEKYRPSSLLKLDYHKEQAKQLKNLISRGDFPHLLVYGPSGSGKKTRIMCLLKELYGPGACKLKTSQMTFTTPSNKKVDIVTLSSSYHIEVNPSDVGIYDRVVITELIKKSASTYQLNSSKQKNFKILLLQGVDGLTTDAQHALRKTMENYNATCRLILCGNSVSNIIPAIKSRCLHIRVPAPTYEDIIKIMLFICKKEGIQLPETLAYNIAQKSGRNLRRAILMCEACRVQQFPLSEDQEIPELDWEIYLRETARLIVAKQTPEILYEARGRIYELLVHKIPADVIFKGLLVELVKNCDMNIKMEIAEAAAYYEHLMHKGSKVIFHIEAFIAKFMLIYSKYLQNSVSDLF